MGSMVLLDMILGVALLLWGLHMVQTGVLRAFGSELRHLLSKALSNRVAAFAAGLGLTTLLQSSTATALMTTSFTAQGFVGLVPALAILLGANVGTALIVSFFRSTDGRARLQSVGRLPCSDICQGSIL